ncbi:hypothetical protein LEP1GSC112_0197 [Leptospira interrogans serovar Pomona str. UT364]|nr:hypothetical protein LEP1GSC112_0197 [Leptospira interrogans serovar Pomona str. UT364]
MNFKNSFSIVDPKHILYIKKPSKHDLSFAIFEKSHHDYSNSSSRSI